MLIGGLDPYTYEEVDTRSYQLCRTENQTAPVGEEVLKTK